MSLLRDIGAVMVAMGLMAAAFVPALLIPYLA